MAEFVNFIRAKLGLEPKREVTLTGSVPTEVIINRLSSIKEDSGYPVSAIPTVLTSVQSILKSKKKKTLPEDVGLESGGTQSTIDAIKPPVPIEQRNQDATTQGGFKRGTRVKIKKDGNYDGYANIDFFDPISKKYMVSTDSGTNLHLDKEELQGVLNDD
jgi:hypothetical protein